MTEPEYVDALKRLQDRFAVRVDNRHGKPCEIVPLACDLKKAKNGESHEEGLPQEEWPEVWCFFDRDQHRDVDQFVMEATRAGVRVAFSHPCFEFWLLLHFRDHAAPAAGVCGTVTGHLRNHLPQG